MVRLAVSVTASYDDDDDDDDDDDADTFVTSNIRLIQCIWVWKKVYTLADYFIY